MNDKFGVKLKKLDSLNSDDSQHIAVVKEIENGK